MDRYLKEVERELKKALKSPSGFHGADYIGGGQSKLTYLGHTSAQKDAVFNKGFSFSKLNPEEQAKVWIYIWENSNTFEAMSLALQTYWHLYKKKKLQLSHWPILKKKIARVDNWAHSDTLSGFYAALLEENPQIFAELKKWNTSKNPWERRASIVGIFYYSSLRKKPRTFKEVIPLVENLLHDKEYYVQKGVGWTLRELYNLYPKETYAFLLKNAKTLSSHAWVASTEKLPAKDKAKLKALRAKK
jgi:3-methyladenine DNA glycosylase AlkD